MIETQRYLGMVLHGGQQLNWDSVIEKQLLRTLNQML